MTKTETDWDQFETLFAHEFLIDQICSDLNVTAARI